MSGVSPPSPSGGAPYKGEYQISPEMRKFWEKLFPGTDLSNKEVGQMTDQFVRNVWNQMNSVLQWALQQQKDRNQQAKGDGGG